MELEFTNEYRQKTKEMSAVLVALGVIGDCEDLYEWINKYIPKEMKKQYLMPERALHFGDMDFSFKKRSGEIYSICFRVGDGNITREDTSNWDEFWKWNITVRNLEKATCS